MGMSQLVHGNPEWELCAALWEATCVTLESKGGVFVRLERTTQRPFG